MGADNWDICPRCVARARTGNNASLAKVMESYGKIPVAEFDELRAGVKDVEPEEYRTFREDYEIFGADEGEVQVSYSGNCSVCRLSVELSERKVFYRAGDDDA